MVFSTIEINLPKINRLISKMLLFLYLCKRDRINPLRMRTMPPVINIEIHPSCPETFASSDGSMIMPMPVCVMKVISANCSALMALLPCIVPSPVLICGFRSRWSFLHGFRGKAKQSVLHILWYKGGEGLKIGLSQGF